VALRPSPFLAAGLAFLSGSSVTGQLAALRFDAQKVPVGRVYQYVKSNRDGSHPGRVSLYVAKADRLESLKWDDEVGWATFVVAELDWSRFSVRRFESYDLRKGKPPLLKATLESDAQGAVSISVLPGPPLRISLWPWHSYDFDFASLGAILPHLVNPEADFTFGRTDFVQEEGKVRFAELGPVHLRFEARERRGEIATRRYRLEGPGLSNTAGTLWADAAEGHLVEFELPIPDEPGFADGRLRLVEVVAMNQDAWESFKHSRLGH
jgi:hypothetical protein